jgi:prepilin-type N-terminal cleavage/methylation domain-containing protein
MPSLMRRTHAPHAQAGFSLVELLIGSAIFLVILGVLSACLSTSSGSYGSANAFITTQDAARRALDTMTRELRSAGSVAVAGGNQLTFQIALNYDQAACPPTGICWGAQDAAGVNRTGWQYQYRLNGTDLIRETLNGVIVVQTRVLANNITEAAGFPLFARTGNVVTINLRAQQTSPQLPGGVVGTGAAPLRARVQLRNS